MGRFIDELRSRGAYLYGSRALKVANEKSDWDWAISHSIQNANWLYKCGFVADGAYDRSTARIKRGMSRTIHKAITQLPGFEGELMKSHRKGNTNVVMFSPLAFAANKYATEMAATYDPQSPQIKTKEARVNTYQRFAQEYLTLYHGTT